MGTAPDPQPLRRGPARPGHQVTPHPTRAVRPWPEPGAERARGSHLTECAACERASEASRVLAAAPQRQRHHLSPHTSILRHQSLTGAPVPGATKVGDDSCRGKLPYHVMTCHWLLGTFNGHGTKARHSAENATWKPPSVAPGYTHASLQTAVPTGADTDVLPRTMC